MLRKRFAVPEFPSASRDSFIQTLHELVPEIRASGTCLDIGCGDGWSRAELEQIGYLWVGADIQEDSGARVVCDGHALPFADGSFDLVLAYAVLEHLHTPWTAIREVARCCKTGAVLAGTCAFLEPHHAQSYFHITHLGLERLLNEGGFQLRRLWPGWHVLQALVPLLQQASYVYRFANLAKFLAPRVATLLHQLRFQSQLKKGSPPDEDWALVDRLAFSGAIAFLAQKTAPMVG